MLPDPQFGVQTNSRARRLVTFFGMVDVVAVKRGLFTKADKTDCGGWVTRDIAYIQAFWQRAAGH
eukprot:357862-Chlamydomonas_euryale.AAC.8